MTDSAGIAITGANGHLGRKLIEALPANQPVVAIVRSARAVAQLPEAKRATARIVDYTDSNALADALGGCAAVVHLVGIIKESGANPFELAHEATCRALAQAAARAGLDRIVQVGLIGADPNSSNACLRSKAHAEAELAAGSVPSLSLRLPMVLGENDYASRALAARARARVALGFRMGSLEQPIYSSDVIAALRSALVLPLAQHGVLDLAGPESLSRAELTQRAARVLELAGPTIVSLPLAVGLLLAAVLEQVSANPPITRAMLGVLDHDDALDPTPVYGQLAITPTSLDDMLRAVLLGKPY